MLDILNFILSSNFALPYFFHGNSQVNKLKFIKLYQIFCCDSMLLGHLKSVQY